MGKQHRKIVMLLDNAFAPDFRVYKEAKCLVDNGSSVKIFAWDRDCERPGQENIDGIEVKRIRTKSKYNLGIRQLISLFLFYLKVFIPLMKHPMDSIHCHDLLMLPMGVLIKIIRRKKLTFDAHEIYWMMEKKKYGKTTCSIIKGTEKFLLRFVDSLITVSEQRKSYYEKYYKKEIFVVGNYYDPCAGKYVEAGSKLKQELGIPEDRAVISYIGSLNAVRDIDLLINYAKENKDIYALIAGKGVKENICREASEKYENIIFPGWVTDPLKYYAAADIIYYVLDDSYEYNHYCAPNNVYIAIALEKPLVANSLGDAGRILSEYKTGAAIEKRTVESLDKAVKHVISGNEAIGTNIKRAQSIFNWQMSEKELLRALDK